MRDKIIHKSVISNNSYYSIYISLIEINSEINFYVIPWITSTMYWDFSQLNYYIIKLHGSRHVNLFSLPSVQSSPLFSTIFAPDNCATNVQLLIADGQFNRLDSPPLYRRRIGCDFRREKFDCSDKIRGKSNYALFPLLYEIIPADWSLERSTFRRYSEKGSLGFVACLSKSGARR